ncbi:MAG TPA: NAD-dependent epimerase/dehydratase family protein [Candidatus Methylomirabilis sp.]|nr:NAD-dependent epimerase/dehydratase family protein [Candidatus Methylomirabilis sp.]
MVSFVTGAAGFIGSNLCAHLLRAGHEVVGFDNFLTGKRENVARVAKFGAAFRFIEGDIRDKAQLNAAIRGARCVVHLAAQGSVQKSFADVGMNNDINVGGFLNVLAAAGEAGAGVFVYASSCAVYGNTETLPIVESLQPAPVSPYAVSKLANELYSTSLDATFPSMSLVGLRLFNIFGPWQDPAGDYAAVVPRWIDRLMRGEPPIIFGDGSATRDFCYVGNVCRFIETLAAIDAKRAHAVYNVGTGKATSLRDLYASIFRVLRELGIRSPKTGPEHRPWRAGDIVHSLSDISSVKRALGYAPGVELDEGLELLMREQYAI